MLKKIRPENILKIKSVKTDNYFREHYVPDSAPITHAVMKLPEEIEEIPQIQLLTSKADVILGSDNEQELEQFINNKWIRLELVLKQSKNREGI